MSRNGCQFGPRWAVTFILSMVLLTEVALAVRVADTAVGESPLATNASVRDLLTDRHRFSVSPLKAATSTLPAACADGSILVIGDLHGDLYKFQHLLAAVGVVDSADFHWRTGCGATVVQLGDMADRGLYAHSLYEYAATLEVEAAAQGGELTFVIGNHELLNLLGHVHHVNPRVFHDGFDDEGDYRQAFAPTGCYGQYILTHPVVTVRRGVVFVHGGLTASYAEKGVAAVNNQFTDAFVRRSEDGSERTVAIHSHPYESANSPLWDRSVLSEALVRNNCEPVHEALGALSKAEGRPIHTMVVGHTVLPNGTPRIDLCGGALVAVDVGLSDALFSSARAGQRGTVPFGYGAMVSLSVAADNASLDGSTVVAPWGLGKRLVTPTSAEQRQSARAAWCRGTSLRFGDVLQNGFVTEYSAPQVLPHDALPAAGEEKVARPSVQPTSGKPHFTQRADTPYLKYGLGLVGIILLLLVPSRANRKQPKSLRRSRKSKGNKSVTFDLPPEEYH